MFEKLNLNKAASQVDIEEYNKEYLEKSIEIVKDFLNETVGKENDAYEIRVSTDNDIRVLLYKGEPLFYSNVKDKFNKYISKEGYSDEYSYDISTTLYGLKITPLGFKDKN